MHALLARPIHRWAYTKDADLATLAAAYGFGLTRGHGYIDGNKRLGFVAMAVFLDLNGWQLEAPEAEVVQVVLAVAAGDSTEAALAAWVRAHLTVPQ